MLLFTQKDLHETGEKLLELNLGPVPRLLLLRDVLRVDPTDPAYIEAQQALETSKWVTLLRESQHSDGTWGRFHTRDSRLRSPFPTTEIAISTALDCGLDKHHPILAKAMAKVREYAKGVCSWPDRAEIHDNPLAWNVWVRHFSAGVLAQVDSTHPALEPFRQVWAEAVKVSFQSGEYDRRAEIRALNDLLGCRMKDPIPFHKKYPLIILSSRRNGLPDELEKRMLEYLLQAPQGIYYVCAGPLNSFPEISSHYFWGWMQGHKLLSRFATWLDRCAEAANWIWFQRDEAGLWDLGSKVRRKPYTSLPLSESWKRPENRRIDSSVEVLSLLSRCFSDE